MRRLAAALVALTLGGPVAAASAGPTEALAASGARLADAVAALAAPGTQDGVASLAAAIAAQDASLAGVRTGVIAAVARERELAFDLQRTRPETERLLLAMQALGRAAPPASALHPAGPLGAARAQAMLGWLTPALQAEAQALGDRLREIDAARALRARGLEELTAGLADLDLARDALIVALAAREAQTVASPAPAAVPAALAREAETLSDLADGLAELSGASDAPPAASESMALRWPVAGAPLRGFAEPDAAGVRRPGLLVQAAPLALVTAPAAAEVRYAGPFLDYGYVVVLEPRADVLVVLAGLATLETRTGARVEPGALLGLLGGRPLDAQEYLMLGQSRTGETRAETLYIELRHGQGPVDPSTWFGDRNG